MNPVPAVFPLLPTIQSYDWGKRGSKSKVAQLAAASNIPGFKLDEQTPYAEVSIKDRYLLTLVVNLGTALDGDTSVFAISNILVLVQ
jgi:hypothetical protein